MVQGLSLLDSYHTWLQGEELRVVDIMGVLATWLIIWKRLSIYLSPSEKVFSIFCHQISLVCWHELSLRFTITALPNSYIKAYTYIPDPILIDPMTSYLWVCDCTVFAQRFLLYIVSIWQYASELPFNLICGVNKEYNNWLLYLCTLYDRINPLHETVYIFYTNHVF